jgi:hypothetical protein
MTSVIYNTVGLFGDVLVIIAYYLLHVDKLKPHSFMYASLNLVGAVLVLFSLFFEWNLPSVFIESAWVIISFYGLIKDLKKKALL